MYKTISNAIIRQFKPCYDPAKVITDENEELPIKDWVQKYRNVIPTRDILWLLLRKEFLSEKDLRLFAVWCARELLKLIENPDERSIEVCNVAERYANGEATKDELYAARVAAIYAANAAANDAAYTVAHAASIAASYASDASYAAYATSATSADIYAASIADSDASYATSADIYDTARDVQLDQLLTYF
jgi:hypothetical protein